MGFTSRMTNGELVIRYLIFLLAICCGSFGVTLTTRATLGVNSVACFSYVSSIYFPITMGTVTIAFNITMLLLQFVMLNAHERKDQFINILMQVPALILFGVMVDVFMYLTDGFHPETYGYAACVATFIVGSLIIAFNISLQSIADVAKLSCDAFVILLAKKINKKLGIVKMCYDLLLVIFAATISLVCSNFTEIIGVREGTIMGAFIVGPAVGFILPHLTFLKAFLDHYRSTHLDGAKVSVVSKS